ncbi:uncharacterized protein LOC119659896 isoform X2 [Hermetia illucens]|uniref:uncharacterized protein LOC119659896 isoform X2 n=1 Tax=Hermetia illucens TaxID=343691 RepID=UPI0018CC64D5|nr:uncharacterized protein LOC119659896 isoform X2 [Hermetia illucens]
MRKKYSFATKEQHSTLSSLNTAATNTEPNLEPLLVENRLLYAHYTPAQDTGSGRQSAEIGQDYYYYVDPQLQETTPLFSTATYPPATVEYVSAPCTITADNPSAVTVIEANLESRPEAGIVNAPTVPRKIKPAAVVGVIAPSASNSGVNTSSSSSVTTIAPSLAIVNSSTNPVSSSLAMSQLGTVYATKRRRRNGKSLKPPPKDGVTKSNPSKRHRERLNAELDLLASLLPFEQNILSKLDRLSILRLSVSYLRTKSYFQVVMHKEKEENGLLPHIHSHDGYRTRELGAFEHGLLDGDMFLQALNGFLMILTCEGEVFFATHSIESYLGFHQSDIVHQSVYELVHSEDREELQRQLLWNSFLPADLSGMPLGEALAPDKAIYLERSFTVRFRCLLDNTSGFLRLDIRGRVKILHGQNRKTEDPPLALFAYCTPFGPPSLLEIPQKENMFKSKHKLDLSLVSMDQRGKMILGYADSELVNMGGYDLVHYDDLAYVASAHQELLKTGASGMIAYRLQKKDGEWQWLQTSSRLVYKNSKPDFVICTHRQLMEEEGRDLLGKRTMDFKVSYLDTGLASTYFSESEQLVVAPTGSPTSLPPPVTPQRTSRRYKTQLRDFLSTCRSKRKLQQTSPLGQVTSPAPVVEYIPDPAAAVAAAYSNLNPMYTTSPYASAADNLYMTPSVHSTNFYPVTENLFHQYRLQGVSGYYPEYHHTSTPTSYVTNGFLSYDGYGISAKEEKWQDSTKYYSGTDVASRGVYSGYCSPTSTPQVIHVPLKTPKSSPQQIMEVVSCSSGGPSPVNSTSSVAINAAANHVTNSSNNNTNSKISNTSSNNANTNANIPNGGNAIVTITPKVEQSPPEHYERQTVLMWGTAAPPPNANNTTPTPTTNTTTRSPNHTPTSNGLYNESAAQLKIDDPHQQQQLHHSSHLKWNGSHKDALVSDVQVYQIHQQHPPTDNVEAIYGSHLSGSHQHAGGHIVGADHQSPHHGHSDVLMQNTAGSHQPHQQHHQQHQHHLQHQQAHQAVGTNSSCEIILGGRQQSIALSFAQQRLHGCTSSPGPPSSSPSSASSIAITPSPSSSSGRHHLSNITAHTALAYASNAYSDHPDGSPLLSFSEVTNTLLNQ